MDPIIVIEGKDLVDLINALSGDPMTGASRAHKLSVHVDGEQAKFKVNERMWSHSMGKKREDG